MRKSLVAIATLIGVTFQPRIPRRRSVRNRSYPVSHHAQLVMQYLRQAQQLTQAIKQTTDMIKNSKILPGQIFGRSHRT